MKTPLEHPTLAELAARHSADAELIVGQRRASWPDLANASVFGGDSSRLAGASIVLATRDPFDTAVALIELDGLARRVVIVPGGASPSDITSAIQTAEADFLLADPQTAQSLPADSRAKRIVPAVLEPKVPFRQAPLETEWVMLTSGSTGTPKLVAHSLATLTAAFRNTPPVSIPSVWCTFYDFRRFGGMQIFLRALFSGSTLILRSHDESLADLALRAAHHQVTHISGTPSHWRSALLQDALHTIHPRYVRLSGEIADQAILNALKENFPNAVVAHAFATTEAGVAFEVNDGLAGIPAHIIQNHDAVELKIEDDILLIRSDRTALRYLGPDAPALKSSDGWVATRDALALKDGRYHFAGRMDGVINVGGLKVHPEEVEAVLNRQPQVAASLVSAKKNPITGALVVANVVLRKTANPNPADQISDEMESLLMQACKAQLPAHKVPTAIRFLDALPLGEAGKLARRA